MIITKKVVTMDDLNKMLVLKTELRTCKPKIWTDGKTTYKKDDSKVASKLKDYFEYYSLIEELCDCEFPREILYLEISKGVYKEFGYTDNFYGDYSRIGFRPNKKVMSLNDKKEIIYVLLDLIRNIHDNGFAHGDLHSQNLLISKNGIKLIDFVDIKIKELTDEKIYYQKLKQEMYYLNLLIFSILFDKPLSFSMEEEYLNFIDSINISPEYKVYLKDTVNFKDSVIDNYPDEYIKHIKKHTYEEGKKLVNSIQV